MIDAHALKQLILQSLPDAEVIVFGEDGLHFEATVISEQFAGKLPLERHRMVYAALGDGMKSQIHALSMKTLTPAERARRGA
jgi:acid stress-induced BolA-like protein IbaG/YrbA